MALNVDRINIRDWGAEVDRSLAAAQRIRAADPADFAPDEIQANRLPELVILARKQLKLLQAILERLPELPAKPQPGVELGTTIRPDRVRPVRPD